VAPNIIHAYAAGVFVARANTQARLAELKAKVDACFRAGAAASGATLKMTPEGAYADHVPNRVLGASYARHFNALHPEADIPLNQDVDEIKGESKASTDQGNISYAMPSLSPGFAIKPGPEGNGPHNPDFATAAGTRYAYERSLRVGKALAATAIDVLTQKGLLEEVKAEWRRDMKKQAPAGREGNVMSAVFN
jgi:metal-dependent amidase/aminoacylase/carboxypeptidase family protein